MLHRFTLSAQFSIYWTGTKVIKHDGSQRHGAGITPGRLRGKTISGIREGRDELLEKAVAIINNPELTKKGGR